MLYNKEKLIRDLDDWAFDIEVEWFKEGEELSPKKKRQHFILTTLREKYYDEYLEEISILNKIPNGIRYFPAPKWGYKRHKRLSDLRAK